MLTFLLEGWMDSRFRGNDGLWGHLKLECAFPV